MNNSVSLELLLAPILSKLFKKIHKFIRYLYSRLSSIIYYGLILFLNNTVLIYRSPIIIHGVALAV